MSLIPRETIFAALFQLAQSITWQWDSAMQTWAYTSRHLRDWSSTPNQPAIYQRQFVERPTQSRGQGGGFATPKWPMYAQWWVYLKAPNPEIVIPSTYMNTVLDAITLAVMPQSQNAIAAAKSLLGQGQTLAQFNGGVKLVENVFIDGEVVLKEPVDTDTQIVMRIPLTISTAI